MDIVKPRTRRGAARQEIDTEQDDLRELGQEQAGDAASIMSTSVSEKQAPLPVPLKNQDCLFEENLKAPRNSPTAMQNPELKDGMNAYLEEETNEVPRSGQREVPRVRNHDEVIVSRAELTNLQQLQGTVGNVVERVNELMRKMESDHGQREVYMRERSIPVPDRSQLERRRGRGQEDDDSSSAEDESDEHSTRADRDRGIKLPPFTGEEAWEVWLNRFEDVAIRRKWGSREKLDALIPRLQGKAGDFVFGQLSRTTRSDYKALTKEINNRFRKVETSKAFGSKFSKRVQYATETVEDFAGELKRLYDKAFPRRDEETRREDLLRKFFDGLQDQDVSFQVEYVKEPSDIDEAVYQVVNYLDAHKKSERGDDSRKIRKTIRMVRADDTDDEEEERVARLPSKSKPTENKSESKEKELSSQDALISELQQLKDTVQGCQKTLGERMDKMENMQSKRGSYNKNNRNQGGNKQDRSFLCYKCGEPGHFARSCPTLMGQFQVTANGELSQSKNEVVKNNSGN